MRFLLIGISIYSLLLFFSCKKVDYEVKAKWIYINETDVAIRYSPDYWNNSFSIAAYDTTIFIENGDGEEEVTADSYVAPFKPYIVYYGVDKCDTLLGGANPRLGDGVRGMDKYESRKLGERYYEFTFRYNQQMIENSDSCQ